MYSNFSAHTTDLFRNRERKVICIYCQLSVLNSVSNEGGCTNEIQKRTRNTKVLVLFVSVVYSNFSYRMTNSCNKDLRIWTVSGDPGTSILNSIDLHSNTLSFSINQFIIGSDTFFLLSFPLSLLLSSLLLLSYSSSLLSLFVLFSSSS